MYIYLHSCPCSPSNNLPILSHYSPSPWSADGWIQFCCPPLPFPQLIYLWDQAHLTIFLFYHHTTVPHPHGRIQLCWWLSSQLCCYEIIISFHHLLPAYHTVVLHFLVSVRSVLTLFIMYHSYCWLFLSVLDFWLSHHFTSPPPHPPLPFPRLPS